MNITNQEILSGGSHSAFYFIIAKYLFTKTKGNKYVFKTDLRIIDKDKDYYEYEIINIDGRICNRIDYNNYYFRDNRAKLYGCKEDIQNEIKENIFNNLTSIEINDGEEEIENYTSYVKFKPTGIDFLILFKNINNDNDKLESIVFSYLDINIYPEFINIIKLLKGLKMFAVGIDCKIENNQLIEMMQNLSGLKYFFSLELHFKRKLGLNEKEIESIKNKFPNIIIKETKNNIYYI